MKGCVCMASQWKHTGFELHNKAVDLFLLHSEIKTSFCAPYYAKLFELPLAIRRSRHASFFSFLAAVRSGLALAFCSFLRCFIWPAVKSLFDGATLWAFFGITAVRLFLYRTLLRIYINIIFKTTRTPHTGPVFPANFGSSNSASIIAHLFTDAVFILLLRVRAS